MSTNPPSARRVEALMGAPGCPRERPKDPRAERCGGLGYCEECSRLALAAADAVPDAAVGELTERQSMTHNEQRLHDIGMNGLAAVTGADKVWMFRRITQLQEELAAARRTAWERAAEVAEPYRRGEDAAAAIRALREGA